jgi:hypothetical protein
MNLLFWSGLACLWALCLTDSIATGNVRAGLAESALVLLCLAKAMKNQ